VAIAAPQITLSDRSTVFTESIQGPRDITVAGDIVRIENGSDISGTFLGSGDVGTILVKGTESVTLIGSDAFSGSSINIDRFVSDPSLPATGFPGSITVEAPVITISDQGRISARTGAGQAGDIVLRGGSVSLDFSSLLDASGGPFGSEGLVQPGLVSNSSPNPKYSRNCAAGTDSTRTVRTRHFHLRAEYTN
jgi:hypothetical protein